MNRPPLTDLPRPVLQRVVVPLTPHAAFDLFTEDMRAWWPAANHSLAGGKVRLEKGPGGKITEELPDGTKAAWARITTWQPGARLGLLWHPGEDEDDGTLVDIRFRASGTGTEVTVEHALPGAAGLTEMRSAQSRSAHEAHAQTLRSLQSNPPRIAANAPCPPCAKVA